MSQLPESQFQSQLPEIYSTISIGDNGGQYNGDPDLSNLTVVDILPARLLSGTAGDIPFPNTFNDSYAEKGLKLMNMPQGISRNRSASEPVNPGNNIVPRFPWKPAVSLGTPSRRSSVLHEHSRISPSRDRQIPPTIYESYPKSEDNDSGDLGNLTKKLVNTSLESSGGFTPSESGEERSTLSNADSNWSPPFTNHSTELMVSPEYQASLDSLLGRTPTRVSLMPFGLATDSHWRSTQDKTPPLFPNVSPVEQKAKDHRSAAAQSEPRFTWSGQLPSSDHPNPVYSPKVFLGGMPYEAVEAHIVEAFKKYGSVAVQWPAKDRATSPKVGYVYVIFEHDRNVKSLLKDCTTDSQGKYYIQFPQPKGRKKDVQVIPWVIADSNYIRTPSQRLDNTKTVFVGALHGMLTAEGLATVMNDLFSNVSYVGIDTDKYKYPMGSARVTFSNVKSYTRAVQAAFIDIRCHRFQKKIQIDPYIDSSNCSQCKTQVGPVFCRNCFVYYCYRCWEWNHSTSDASGHRPLMRARRSEAANNL